MAYFPMMVSLENRPVLVVGGGAEGLKKVRVLHDFGARITLVAKDALPEASALAEKYAAKAFTDEDLDGEKYAVVVAATDEEELNRRISSLCTSRGIPVNIVDRTELCTFIFPAIIRENDLVCAVSSSGKSPLVTQHIKALIQRILPEKIGQINDRMGEYRIQAKAEIPNAGERRKDLKSKLEELLAEEQI